MPGLALYDQTWVAVLAAVSSLSSSAMEPEPSPAAVPQLPPPKFTVLLLLNSRMSLAARMWKPCSPPFHNRFPLLKLLAMPPTPPFRTQTVCPARVTLVRQLLSRSEKTSVSSLLS